NKATHQGHRHAPSGDVSSHQRRRGTGGVTGHEGQEVPAEVDEPDAVDEARHCRNRPGEEDSTPPKVLCHLYRFLSIINTSSALQAHFHYPPRPGQPRMRNARGAKFVTPA